MLIDQTKHKVIKVERTATKFFLTYLVGTQLVSYEATEKEYYEALNNLDIKLDTLDRVGDDIIELLKDKYKNSVDVIITEEDRKTLVRYNTERGTTYYFTFFNNNLMTLGYFNTSVAFKESYRNPLDIFNELINKI